MNIGWTSCCCADTKFIIYSRHRNKYYLDFKWRSPLSLIGFIWSDRLNYIWIWLKCANVCPLSWIYELGAWMNGFLFYLIWFTWWQKVGVVASVTASVWTFSAFSIFARGAKPLRDVASTGTAIFFLFCFVFKHSQRWQIYISLVSKLVV